MTLPQPDDEIVDTDFQGFVQFVDLLAHFDDASHIDFDG